MFRQTGFLIPEDHAALLAWVAGGVEAAASTLGDGATSDDRRRSRTATLPPEIRRRLLAAFRPALPRILDALGMHAFEPAFETELVIYGDGAFFRRHIDTGGTQVRRLVSAVYYFHREPRAFTGGQLRLHPFGPGVPQDIEPEQNLLVAFPSFAPHEVLPVAVPGDDPADARHAINIWVHRTTLQR